MLRHLFMGTGYLTKLMIHQNRFKLVFWLIGLVAVTILVANAYPDIYPDEEARMAFALTSENPAMIAMLGKNYENYDVIGSLFAHEMLLFTAIAAAIMNILIVGRSTRADEEDGRVELIRSLPVGRLAYLTGATIVIVCANVLLAIGVGLGITLLGIDGMEMPGAFLYGAILGATGMVFAAITALFAQLSETSRGATMFSFGILIASYLMRAIGDVNGEVLSLLSPLGWTVRTNVFAENDWWPIYVAGLVTCIIGIGAFYLNGIRDLESGFIPERKGHLRASAFLQSRIGLAFRLQRTNIVSWGLGIFLLSASFGAVLGDLEEFFADLELMQGFLSGDPDQSLTEQFVVLLMAIMSLISAVPVIMTVLKLKAEENKNLTENYFSGAISRIGLLGSYIILAILVSLVMQLAVVLGLWSVGQFVMDDAVSFGTTIGSAFAYLPAMWVIMGAVVFLIGFVPKGSSLIWLYVIYVFIIMYLGGILDIPDWLNSLSTFHHISEYPVEEINVTSIIILVAVASMLIIVGGFGYRKRDIQG